MAGVVTESFANIRLFDIREIGKQLFDGAAGRQRLDNHADGYAHATDAWLAAHDLGIHRNAVELLHVVMTAQVCHDVSEDARFQSVPRRGELPSFPQRARVGSIQ